MNILFIRFEIVQLMEESNVSTFKQHTKDDSEESSSHSQKAKMKRRSSGKRSTEFSSGICFVF
jgi:hypothetical protein